MSENTWSCVLHQSFPFVVAQGALLTGFGRDFQEIKDEHERIQTLLKDADAKASDGEVKTRTKQLREASFRIEDVIDEYDMYMAQRVNDNHSGFKALIQKVSQMVLNLKSRYQFAYEIHDIKLSVARINKRSSMFEFQPESGSGSSRGTKAARFGNPQMATFSFKEAQVVGFESQRDELVSCLVEGTNELMLVSVVGMGGLGKTTLIKYVLETPQVKKHFDCCFYISASQSKTAEELLIDMINKFCEDSKESAPNGLKEMDQMTLTTRVIQYLRSKRYLLWFDDVRNEHFSKGIAHAMPENEIGSRIIVATRMMRAAEYFKEHFSVHIHILKPLPDDKALELFWKKAFRGQCPTDLENMSKEIVQKCGGLPLAIVTIGGLLLTKPKTIFEWGKFSQNLGMELDGNMHFTSLTTILSRSYDDLQWHLKLCMLYFGIYPEHHTINCKRLIGQWIAEGFVKYEEGRTLEEVAERYLKELIQTSLVQVSSVGFDGKVKSCEVHNLLRHIIIRKMKDLCFCHIMYEDHEQVTVDITRRFSIVTFSNNVLRSNSNPGIRAIFVFDKEELPEYFIDSLSIKFKLIKVLNFERSLLKRVPENLGNLFHLKYLNLSHTEVTVLPRSIGNLLNLETLDLRQTKIHELPMEIKNLTKLRLLTVYYKYYEGNYSTLNDTTGVQMQEGIGCLKSLQNLSFLEADHGEIDHMQELKKLKQVKKLGIRCVQSAQGNALCAAIGEMNFLESLNITAKAEDEILDLDFVSAPRYLRVINIKARLARFPDWIPELEYLVKLMLGFSNFEHDPLDSLRKLPNLSRLNLWDDAFAGDSLHFKVGGFPKLKELDLTRLNKLSSISIDREALLALEHFRCHDNPQLKVLPKDLQNLENLKYLEFADMPVELVDSIDPNKDGPCHRIINHIPRVQVREKVESSFPKYELRLIPTQLNI
ncbi:unnamed protein product [Trifolium pratense]|uniref:Uncharacterized protein n=1 Tax=Trifolium pratense TaxID=57577 RepID=A0ACB0J389_TRIPR|nr:unnamed protein product [Trifolium pratense]